MTSRRPRIAVIDDDELVLTLARDLLALDGDYDTRTHGDVRSGAAFVRDVRPDLVILDLVQGDEDVGWDTLEELRAQAETQAVPVILCSASGVLLRKHRQVLPEQTWLIEKPFEIEDLLGLVQRALQPQRTQAG